MGYHMLNGASTIGTCTNVVPWSSLFDGDEGLYQPKWNAKIVESVHEVQFQYLFDNWADTSLHLLLLSLQMKCYTYKKVEN